MTVLLCDARAYTSALALCLAVAMPVAGQTVATTFEQARDLIAPGDTVYVVDGNGREIRGKLGRLSSPSLELLGGPTFLEGNVRRIRVLKKDPVWDGTLVGLASVGVPWLVVCATDDAWCEYGELGAENMFRVIAVMTTLAGGVVGATVDGLINGKVVVYRASPAPNAVTLSMSPLVSASRTGVRLAVRF
jgi:hypothetical protein